MLSTFYYYETKNYNTVAHIRKSYIRNTKSTKYSTYNCKII